MNTKEEVQAFLALTTIAFAGLSRDPNAFSARVFDELTKKGYRLIPINPKADRIKGIRCYPTLSSAPGEIEGVLVFTPPAETESIVREAVELGVRHVWIQQGAESGSAIRVCTDNHLSAVTGHCILMFARPVGTLHAIHRWFKRLVAAPPV